MSTGTEKNEYEKAYAEKKARERAEHEAEWMKYFGEAARGARSFEERRAEPGYQEQLKLRQLWVQLGGEDTDVAFAEAEAVANAMQARGQCFGVNTKMPPPRPWLYGHKLLRNHVALSIATGGAGKSIVAMTEAIAMATGRKLLHIAPQKPLSVVYYNLEDTTDELARRFYAICKHYQVPREALGDRLNFYSGRAEPLILVKPESGVPTVHFRTALSLIKLLQSHKADVLVIDPLVSAHRCNESDNTAMDLVVKTLNQICDFAEVGLYVIHHVRKMAAGEDTEADASRGASAIVNAARIVNRLRRMTKEEAALAKIPEKERHDYVSELNVKANFSAMGDGYWYKLVAVPLGNEAPDFPGGDQVSVPTPWQWPDLAAAAKEQRSDPVLIREVQAIVRGGQWRAYHSTKEFIGPALYPLLGLDPKVKTRPAASKQVEALIAGLVADGWLKEVPLEVVRKNRAKEYIAILAVGRETEEPGAGDGDDDADIDDDGDL